MPSRTNRSAVKMKLCSVRSVLSETVNDLNREVESLILEITAKSRLLLERVTVFWEARRRLPYFIYSHFPLCSSSGEQMWSSYCFFYASAGGGDMASSTYICLPSTISPSASCSLMNSGSPIACPMTSIRTPCITMHT